MEYIARTVTNPNTKISRDEAESQLRAHPQFKVGTVIVNLDQRRSGWVAQIHEPKVAKCECWDGYKRVPGKKPCEPGSCEKCDKDRDKKKSAAPFPPPTDSEDSPVPSESEDKPSEDEDPLADLLDEDAPKEDSKDEDSKSEKVDLNKIMDLVTQIAQAVGVSPEGLGSDGPPAGPEGHGPHGPGPGGDPASLPEAGPAHDQTVDMGNNVKQIIHRKAPPGATPVGSSAFASVGKVASFQVEEPTNLTLAAAKAEIEDIYGSHGYRVKKIAEASDSNGNRTVRALVSVR